MAPPKKGKKKSPWEKRCDKQANMLNKCKTQFKVKFKTNDKYSYLLNKILEHTKTISLPDYKCKIEKKPDKILYDDKSIENTSHSWFNITEYIIDDVKKVHDIELEVPIVEKLVKCEKYKMYPNALQKKLLLNWMYSYVTMYNETIKLFKKNRINKVNIPLNWKTIRTKYLKPIKQKILNESNITIKSDPNLKTRVNSHILDFAIQDACAKYKTCLTNLKNGHIKHFRLRYLKQSKDTLIMKIEKDFIDSTNNTFCNSVFKDAFKFQNNFQLKNIKCDFTIHYNQKTDEFQLLNPVKIDQIKEHDIKESGAGDPGLRTFLTVFSNGKCIKIGDNLIKTILKYTQKIDKLNSKANKKKPKIKEKLLKKYYKKIKNLIDDLHWKTINYLTTNFGNVLIGNMSTKSIISNKLDNQLNDNLKRVAQHMRLYEFRQRLEYKCLQRMVGYMNIDEAYTTMTCTKCGYKNDVKKKKVINCKFCKLKIDRDFSGARNIMLRGTGL